MPTPPNTQGYPNGAAAGAAAGTATQSFASTKTQDALAFVDQLESYVGSLKRELRAYGDANTVGRDTQALRELFANIHQCEVQIAQAMGIDWTPADWSPSNST